MCKQRNREQAIMESLIATLGYREQKIKELENENVAWKARAEIAERRNTFLLRRIKQLGGTVIDTEEKDAENKSCDGHRTCE